MPAAADVEQYINSAPQSLQDTLHDLRRLIRESLPAHAQEQIGSSGFPVYTINGEWRAGFAYRSKGPMLYIMKSGVLDRHEKVLGRLRSGRSCVEWKETPALPLAALRDLARTMLTEAGRP